jgi:hypothetical protein
MVTSEQLKKVFFAILLKQPHGIAIDDVVIPAIVIKDLYKKYQYDITVDEFDQIGDQLEAGGYFRWNEDGLLAITESGLNYIEHNRKGL